MGNSPSFGLGVRDTRSSRDVRMRDPEKEVERSSASRAPTHNVYGELPASQNPHSTANLIDIQHDVHPCTVRVSNNHFPYQRRSCSLSSYQLEDFQEDSTPWRWICCIIRLLHLKSRLVYTVNFATTSVNIHRFKFMPHENNITPATLSVFCNHSTYIVQHTLLLESTLHVWFIDDNGLKGISCRPNSNA